MAISPNDFGASFKDFLDQMSAAVPAAEPVFHRRLHEHFGQEPHELPHVDREVSGFPPCQSSSGPRITVLRGRLFGGNVRCDYGMGQMNVSTWINCGHVLLHPDLAVAFAVTLYGPKE